VGNSNLSSESGHSEHGYGSSAYLWWVIFLLTLASTLSMVDRLALNVMIGPIKRDLGGLTDFQFALIAGIAFTLFYTILSGPAGWIADRYNRRNLMAGGVIAWSIMTFLCGMAGSFWTLFFARMGVGVGEATLGPAANSTLADYFNPSRLPLAIAIVAAAPFVGQGLTNVVGAPMVQYLEQVPNIVLPIIGEVYSWQMVFIVLGIPGVLIGLLVLTIKEPPRKGKLDENSHGTTFAVLWDFIVKRWLFFFLIFAAYLGLSIQGWGLFTWFVEFYIREHQWTRTEIGVPYGLIAMCVGIIGSISAGAIAGWWLSRGTVDAPVKLVFWGTVALIPLGFLLWTVPDGHMGIAILVPTTFLMAMPSGLIMTTLQSICPNELRGQIIAFYLISVNFLAYTFAPMVPAIVSDIFFGSEDVKGIALAFMAIFTYGGAALCLYLCLKPYRAALEEAKAWIGKPAVAA
jgi:MFS family permease